MAMWALIRANCKIPFQCSPISEVELSELFLPLKPMPSAGEESACPGCGHVALYQTYDLRYWRSAVS